MYYSILITLAFLDIKMYNLLVIDTILSSLEERRRSLGLTQAEVAKRAGLSQTHYSRIEQGKIDPRLTTLQDVARALSAELLVIPTELVSTVNSMALRDSSADKKPLFRAEPD
jgi:predicted transcriptional regulator